MLQSAFWVKKVSHASANDFPQVLVVIVIGSSNPQLWHGEYFIFISDSPFIPDSSQAFYPKSYEVDDSYVPELTRAFDLYHIPEWVESRVKEKLRLHFGAEFGLSSAYNLQDGENDDIKRLWIQKKFQQEIRLMESKTRSEKLKIFLSEIVR